MENLNIFTADKLKEVFEPALVEEINAAPTVEVSAGSQVGLAGSNIEAIPIVIQGSIKVYRPDKKGKDIKIYDITPGQSCIISINHSMKNEKSPSFAKATLDTKLIMVDPQKSKEWMGKYSSWRDFVFNLYDLRLNELIQQHEIVTKQRDQILVKSDNIQESIRYALRIQKAVMPPVKILDNLISEHFIFNKPRDIVSGDFYWFTEIENKIIIAAADATGHGVPGAFMSLLGISFLNEITTNHNINSAGEILNQLRNKVKRITAQSEHNTTDDGMDIALCVIDCKEHVLNYAGAHNPLFLFRKNELIEVKADRMPIGNYAYEKGPFTNHQIKLEANDTIYMFSDGFADQNGGEKNRKYMTKNFRTYIKSIHTEPLQAQKQKLENEFNKWKEGHSQVDDVLVVGVKVL